MPLFIIHLFSLSLPLLSLPQVGQKKQNKEEEKEEKEKEEEDKEGEGEDEEEKGKQEEKGEMCVSVGDPISVVCVDQTTGHIIAGVQNILK